MNTDDALWASARVRALIDAGNAGGVIRLARQALCMRQEDLAAACGYSRSTISRLETGSRAGTDVAMIRAVANRAGVPTAVLGAVLQIQAPLPATVSATAAPARPGLEVDPVRRRELLTGLASVSAAVMLPAAKTAAAAGPDPVTAAIEKILSSAPGPAAPVAAGTLEPRVAAAWQAFNACRYQALSAGLPGLVATAAASRADAAPGAESAAASRALAGTYTLVSELAVKAGDDGMSWVAADRALAAARDSGDPATIAAASRAVAIAMRRAGHYDAATTMLTRTALSLDADHGAPPRARPRRLRLPAVHRRLLKRTARPAPPGPGPDRRSRGSRRPHARRRHHAPRVLRNRRRGLPDRHLQRTRRLRRSPHPRPLRDTGTARHP